MVGHIRDKNGRWISDSFNNIKECTRCKKIKDIADFSKDNKNSSGYGSICKECKCILAREWSKNNPHKKKLYRENHPWQKTLKSIKSRCNNPKCESYKRYGAIGIKCLITAEELRQLWFRDKAYLMKRPSIDRKDSDNHYTFNNCQFIELKENVRKSRCHLRHSSVLMV